MSLHELVSHRIEDIEDEWAIRAGLIPNDRLRSYVQPSERESSESGDRLLGTIYQTFPELGLIRLRPFTDILEYDAFRRALTSSLILSLTQPEYRTLFSLPEITEDNADMMIGLLKDFLDAGRLSFKGFRWYDSWRKATEKSSEIGAVQMASGSVSPFRFNEDRIGIREHRQADGRGTHAFGMYTVADGMINREYRDRSRGPDSRAAHHLVRMLHGSDMGTERKMRRAVGRINSTLYADNLIHGRIHPRKRHGAAFTTAQIIIPETGSGRGEATVRLTQTGDTGATIVRAKSPVDTDRTVRVFELPGNWDFLGLEPSLHPDALQMTETILESGDMLFLWTDGILSLPDNLIYSILTRPETTVTEKLDCLLWASMFRQGNWSTPPDESSAILLKIGK